MGGEALGSGKVLCPSIGECQGQEAEVGKLVSRVMGEDPHRSRGKRDRIWGLWRGNEEGG